MQPILETDRLRLRTFTLDDTAFIIALLNSPGWLQFIGDRNVTTSDQARRYLENGPLKSYADHGYGLSLVERKADGQPVGMTGILHRQHLAHPDLGFALLPDCTGQGYALEIVTALLEHARREWHLSEILAIALPGNSRSIRLLEKLGFAFVESILLPQGEETLQLYRNAQE